MVSAFVCFKRKFSVVCCSCARGDTICVTRSFQSSGSGRGREPGSGDKGGSGMGLCYSSLLSQAQPKLARRYNYTQKRVLFLSDLSIFSFTIE